MNYESNFPIISGFKNELLEKLNKWMTFKYEGNNPHETIVGGLAYISILNSIPEDLRKRGIFTIYGIPYDGEVISRLDYANWLTTSRTPIMNYDREDTEIPIHFPNLPQVPKDAKVFIEQYTIGESGKWSNKTTCNFESYKKKFTTVGDLLPQERKIYHNDNMKEAATTTMTIVYVDRLTSIHGIILINDDKIRNNSYEEIEEVLKNNSNSRELAVV